MEPGRADARTATDAVLASGGWVVGERYVIHEGIDRYARDFAWLPLEGRPDWPEQRRDGSLVWPERDHDGRWRLTPDSDRRLRDAETRVRVIVDESPDPRTRTPRVWVPGQKTGLSDELARLGEKDDTAIVRWVEANGFVGVRADPRERQESVEEIRWALQRLALARDLLGAIRKLVGDDLRAEAERLLNIEHGFLAEVNRDSRRAWDDEEGHHEAVVRAIDQPMGGPHLARAYGIVVPEGQRWPGAGAHIQVMYALSEELRAPLEHLLRVQAGIVPTGDGMRLQAAVVAPGPLATAYLQTLDEASWPALTYVGDVLRIDWRAPRRCRRCGQTFRPARRNQLWCGKRCRWAASKARTTHPDSRDGSAKTRPERSALA